MTFAIVLTDEQWDLVADPFDPSVGRGAPAVIPRWRMVEAVLFIGRTGCQWRAAATPTFLEPGGRGGRTVGSRRTLLVEILGLPVAADA